ncbi:MAG: carbohydrate ABC transporter permease [Candidatus Hodarchaeales archaeon]|jgi:ABC-type glycerol-3-phosphate transport system permease component
MATIIAEDTLSPPQSRIRIEHISFITIMMTLFICLSAFWEFQIRIWNRVEYNVGPWPYNLPYFAEDAYPSGPYLEYMLNQAILFVLTALLFDIFLMLFVLVNARKEDSDRTLSVSLVLAGIVSLIAFWNYKAVQLAPKNWFEEAILQSEFKWEFGGFELPGAENNEDRYQFIESMFQFVLIISLAVFIAILAILIYRVASRDYKQFAINLAILLSLVILIFVISTVIGYLQATFFTLLGASLVWVIFQRNRAAAIRTVLFYIVMFGFLIYTIIPVLYTFGLSMSSNADINANRFTPSKPIDNFIINYSSVIFILNGDRAPSFSSSFLISLGLGFATAVGGLIITLPAAYAISRFRFKGKKSAEFLVIATQMFPGIILLLPQFFFWKQLGLLDPNHPNRLIIAVLLAYFVGALAYNVWMMRGYFDTLPRDLEEAALIDGSSTFGAFARIAIPLAAPGMVAVSIFTFLGAWNEFALAQVFIGEGKRQATLPLLFYQYQDTSAPDNPPFFQLLSAFSILAALPIVIVFLTLQKYLAQGLTSGGVK